MGLLKAVAVAVREAFSLNETVTMLRLCALIFCS